jgi:hypothetical protein
VYITAKGTPIFGLPPTYASLPLPLAVEFSLAASYTVGPLVIRGLRICAPAPAAGVYYVASFSPPPGGIVPPPDTFNSSTGIFLHNYANPDYTFVVCTDAYAITPDGAPLPPGYNGKATLAFLGGGNPRPALLTLLQMPGGSYHVGASYTGTKCVPAV